MMSFEVVLTLYPGNRFNYNNGKQFSTRNQDNDGSSNHDFAERYRGGWWYHD